MDIIREFARHFVDTGDTDIPPQAIEAAKTKTIDSLTTALATDFESRLCTDQNDCKEIAFGQFGNSNELKGEKYDR